MKRVMSIILGMVLVGCYSAVSRYDDDGMSFSRNRISLLVINSGTTPIKIYDLFGSTRLAWVFPSKRECVILRNTASVQHFVVDILGMKYYSTDFDPDNSYGWVWDINSDLPTHSMYNLLPTEVPCHYNISNKR